MGGVVEHFETNSHSGMCTYLCIYNLERNVISYLPIHMLAWQDSAEESWPGGPSLAPPADNTSAAWLVMSR